MPWNNDPASRARAAVTYGPEYRRNRELAKRRAGGRCESCGRRGRLQCDHIVNTASTGQPDHSLGNLQMLCEQCHRAKTAGEGGGWRRRRDPPPQQRTNW